MNKEDLIKFYNSFYKEEELKSSDSYYEQLEEKARKLLEKKKENNSEITFNKLIDKNDLLKFRIINCKKFRIIQGKINLKYMDRDIRANIKEEKEIYSTVTKQYSKIHKDLNPNDIRFKSLNLISNGNNFYFNDEELYQCAKYLDKFSDLDIFV